MNINVTVENLLNDRINVTDRNGQTPNRFQPAYLDPIRPARSGGGAEIVLRGGVAGKVSDKSENRIAHQDAIYASPLRG